MVGVHAVWTQREERDCDGELGGEEEGKVEEAGPGEAGVAGREGFEAILENVFVGVRTDA